MPTSTRHEAAAGLAIVPCVFLSFVAREGGTLPVGALRARRTRRPESAATDRPTSASDADPFTPRPSAGTRSPTGPAHELMSAAFQHRPIARRARVIRRRHHARGRG